jgi:hypothetical protein
MDWTALILKVAVRRMPAQRREWGAAMQAELAHIQDPLERWLFAWNCLRVALFPPSQGGFMNDRFRHVLKTFGLAAVVSLLINGAIVALSSDNLKSGQATTPLLQLFRNWLVLSLVLIPIVSGLGVGGAASKRYWQALAAAVLFGLLSTAPLALMEWWNNPVVRSGEVPFPLPLFFALWLLPSLFFLGAIPIVRGLRAGESILVHPLALLLRLAVMVLLAMAWVNLVHDQMPCFLGGVPGCD